TVRFTPLDTLPPDAAPILKKLNIQMTVNYGPRDDCQCDGGDCPPGKVTPTQHSVDVKVHLGKDEYGIRGSFLRLKQDLPGNQLSRVESLAAIVGTNSEVIFTNSVLRQIRTPKVLADIVTNTYSYDISFYYTNDISPNKTNNVWVPIGTAYKTVTIQNPDGGSASNKLVVTDREGSITNISRYTWDNTNTWTFEPPGGLRKETLTRTGNSNNTERLEVHSVLETNGTLVFQEQKKFKAFGWGEQLIEHVIDPYGARLTNTWEYYTNSADTGKYGQLKARTESSGFWERYDYDSSSRETNRVTGYLNATNGAPADQARQRITSYDSSDPRVTVK